MPERRLKIDVELLLVETLGCRNDWHLRLRLYKQPSPLLFRICAPVRDTVTHTYSRSAAAWMRTAVLLPERTAVSGALPALLSPGFCPPGFSPRRASPDAILRASWPAGILRCLPAAIIWKSS